MSRPDASDFRDDLDPPNDRGPADRGPAGSPLLPKVLALAAFVGALLLFPGLRSFILVLGVLIFVHELGHFLAAKAVGIGVPRFSIGLGPITPLAFRRGETDYVISWIPFGGYVKMASREEQEAIEALEGGRLEAPFPPEKLFESKSVAARIFVISAGVVMNALFAWLAFFLVFALYGKGELVAGIGEVSADSPAAEAGLAAGDLIVEIDGAAVATWSELVEAVQGRAGEELDFAIDRDGERLELVVTPAEETATDPLTGEQRQVGRIGIRPLSGRQIRTPYSATEALVEGARQTARISAMVLLTLKGMVLGRISARELGGPILIAQVSGEAARAGFEVLLSFTAFLSVNLAIFNLLPIPVLDGGHLVFLVLEAVRRRPLSRGLRMRLTQLGFYLLLGFMLLVVVNDLMR